MLVIVAVAVTATVSMRRPEPRNAAAELDSPVVPGPGVVPAADTKLTADSVSPAAPEGAKQSRELMFEFERVTAEWIIQHGGVVTITYETNDGWLAKRTGRLSELLDFPLTVQTVELLETTLTVNEMSRLRHLHALKGLQISGPYITDEVFRICNPTWRLQWLYTSCPHLTNVGFDALKNYEQTLLTLSVNRSQISDDAVADLKSFPLLRQVLAANTGLTDRSITHFMEFPSLVSLDISDTAVTQAGLKQLSQFRRLTKLQIRNLPLTDEGLATLIDLPLVELDLTGTQVSAAAVQAYQAAHENCAIQF